MRKRFIPKGQIAYTTRLKPGERSMDKRYKDGVDTGRFSTNRIPLPLKPLNQITVSTIVDDTPKQVLRHKKKPGNHRGKTNFQ